jgi:Co/Zn/Cd efflux system component
LQEGPLRILGAMSHTTARRVEPHDHAHEHEHGHGCWLRRVWHELSEAVGGRSHDAADQADDVLEADAAGRRALLLSLAGLGLTAAVQGAVVVMSGSVALLGDTLHNVADALTAVPLLVAFALHAGRRRSG